MTPEQWSKDVESLRNQKTKVLPENYENKIQDKYKQQGFDGIEIVGSKTTNQIVVFPEAQSKISIVKADVVQPPTKPVEGIEATPEQKAQAHIIAKQKALISEKGKPKPQYRYLAKSITGVTSIKDMTQEQAGEFINTLQRLPEPTYRGGRLVPPTITRKTALVPQDFFQSKFKKPTPAKLITSQSRYADLLGVKKLVEPLEVGKVELQKEYAQIANQIDKVNKDIKKVISPEEMAIKLNTLQKATPDMTGKEKEAFDYFDALRREMLDVQNEVYRSVGLPEIKGIKAYFRHIADEMSKEVLEGKYPLPEGLKYWSEQVVSKKVYNPMTMHRKLRDDLLEHFSKDLPYVMKSMVWTALKVKHLTIPKKVLNSYLGALTKDKPIYDNLTPAEKKIYDEQVVMPASTKKWLLDYVNIVLGDRQTALDESVNLWVTDTPIKGLVNAILKPFGKHLSKKPVTDLISKISRLPIYGAMAGFNPRQLIRNKFQLIQNLSLYGVNSTLKGFLSDNQFPALKRLKTDSLFLKSYSGFEDLPLEMVDKLTKAGLAPYQWTALSNVSQTMDTAYHWTADKIQNPEYKEHGWADPQRTYTEDSNFFYPSEEAKLLKEMEYGAHTTQYGYLGLHMPEIFRYKSLAGITRLQSWWMNHWAVFHRESATRAFTGHTGYDKNLLLTLGDRFNYLKYLILGGLVLSSLDYGRSYLLGTAPTSLPPSAQLALGLYQYFTNLGNTSHEKWKRAQAVYMIKSSAKIHIPLYLTVKDMSAFIRGDKHWTEYLFYKKKEKGTIKFQ